MGRVRSAEQVARVLLSNAVRYDTWECRASKDGAVGPLMTLKFEWKTLPVEPPFDDAVAINMTLYDKSLYSFVGATYSVSRITAAEPLLFQSRGDNVVLAVEVVSRDNRPDAPVEGHRVILWGYAPIVSLSSCAVIALTPGSAQLLQLDPKSWPVCTSKEVKLEYTCSIETDAAVVQLLTQLVPPGVMVSQSFTRGTPSTASKTFRCVVRNIYVSPATPEDEKWFDSDAEWRIAAVSHNGYQQLGDGAEIPLTFITGEATGSSTASMTGSEMAMAPSTEHQLRSTTTMEMDGLPVHSGTSLVLAIRRRRKGESQFEVLGFCVFPLCVMPMENRDIRVENLPALHGPFSCRDPRLLVSEAASPYGKLPIAVTLTVEYHQKLTSASSSFQAIPLVEETAANVPQPIEKDKSTLDDTTRRLHRRRSGESAQDEVQSSPFVEAVRPMEILSTEDQAVPGSQMGGFILPHDALTPPELTYPTTLGGETAAMAGEAIIAGTTSGVSLPPSMDVFKMLCNIMEELRRLRELQDATSKQLYRQRARSIPSHKLDEVGRLLDDVTTVDVVDLAPQRVAVPWEVRCRMQDDLQPILHPVHGTRLDDRNPASGNMSSSLCGIRFEGVTVDVSVELPEDICFMFSFGPLPYQTIGPIHTACIEKDPIAQTYKLYERGQRGGMVWCEPIEAAEDPFLLKFKQNSESTLYLHVYDALNMFYVASANVNMEHFRRPYNAESALIPLDLILYKDLSLTEQTVPSKVLPIVRNAGQVHVTLFCVGVPGPDAAVSTMITNSVMDPPRGSRVIVAKRLPHLAALTEGASSLSSDVGGEVPTTKRPETGRESNPQTNDMHWRRAQYVKQLYASGTVLPGVPLAHTTGRRNDADLEFRLRYLERQRDEAKSRRIAESLIERLTVRHNISVASCQPETTRTLFQNPFTMAMQFRVEVDTGSMGSLEMKSSPTFYLGPREQGEILLIVRLQRHMHHHHGSDEKAQQDLQARVYTEKHELVRIIDVHASVGPPFIDRRYEIFGQAGTTVSKKLFSRLFSSSSFPMMADRNRLLGRMRDLCAYITVTSEHVTAEANCILDPITQTFVTAWEEITVSTTIPNHAAAQRVEYMTLYADASMSKVIETWELCIFACRAVTSREVFFGQTTLVALPADGVEALYCSDNRVRVERRDNSYTLHLRPREAQTQQMLLHALKNEQLVKTILTVPSVYPQPTYMQALEFTPSDTTAPIFRRLQFIHRGSNEEVFTVHHNYKYQLHITPKQFALAPGDSQFITLQLDMLCLPEGQLEGRWPMWIFINNTADKTVESYLLQVVLRAHPILRSGP